jgi:hypothetical protein
MIIPNLEARWQTGVGGWKGGGSKSSQDLRGRFENLSSFVTMS